MSVLMVFCGPHLPLAFHFVCVPGGVGGRKQNGRQAEGFPLFTCAAAGGLALYRMNSSICWMTPFRNNYEKSGHHVGGFPQFEIAHFGRFLKNPVLGVFPPLELGF